MPLIETRFYFSGGGKGNPAIFHPLLPKTEAPALWKHLSIQNLAAYESDQIQFFIYTAFCIEKIPYSQSLCRLLKQSGIYLPRSDQQRLLKTVKIVQLDTGMVILWRGKNSKCSNNLGTIATLFFIFKYPTKKKTTSECCEVCLPSFHHIVSRPLMTSLAQQPFILMNILFASEGRTSSGW